MVRKNLINKKATKHHQGKCYFCDVTDYACLHCHRIIPGEDGGIYSDANTLVVCSNCHNKIHANLIKIDRKYKMSNGKWLLHFWENNEEKWL